jgi:hypothetical protein
MSRFVALAALALVGALLPGVEGRAQDKAVRRELDRWQGVWKHEDSRLHVRGNRMAWVGKGERPKEFGLIVKIVRIRDGVVHADILNRVDGSPDKGKTLKAIFRFDGDTLHYCGTYGPKRPTEFKSEDVGDDYNYYVPWKRLK